jgi:hypothetical protein
MLQPAALMVEPAATTIGGYASVIRTTSYAKQP